MNVGAFKLTLKRARDIASLHPHIAREYREGASLEVLAERYSPDYEISHSVAINSIWHALDILMSKREMNLIGRDHCSSNAREMVRMKKGLFCASAEKQREMRRDSILARGITPYDGEKVETKYGLLSEKDYIIKLKERELLKRKGCLKWKDIVEESNEVFNTDRAWSNVKALYNKYWCYGCPDRDSNPGLGRERASS